MPYDKEVIDRFHALPREKLLLLPTPLHKLNALSRELNLDVWIKRDDLTGFAMGGNKGRKLEYLMPEALKAGADWLISCGAEQSNHVRQVAAAASMYGMGCTTVLLGSPDSASNGNLVLERWLGAEQVWTSDELWKKRDLQMWDELDAALHEETEKLKARGKQPFVIPLGGSTPQGVCGFINAVKELNMQTELLNRPPFDSIVFASSSGGTQTGLHLGCHLFNIPSKVIGICADAEDLRDDFVSLAHKTGELLNTELNFVPQDFNLIQDYVGNGYGLPTEKANEAIMRIAKTEGIFLDPVYTGKAMAGLIDMAREGYFEPNSSILFWHTGGVPALFAEEYELLI